MESCASQPEKSIQTFVGFGVKLTLAKYLILKILDRHVRVELKVVSYIWKKVLLVGRKGERKKKGTERKDGEMKRKYESYMRI